MARSPTATGPHCSLGTCATYPGAGRGLVTGCQKPRAAGNELGDGSHVPADLVVVGVAVNAWRPTPETRIRVQHPANALNQPRTAAAAITGGRTAYDRLPYFYSDQDDLGLEYTGHVGRDDVTDVVVRGDEASGELMAFWTREGRVVAGLCVNIWDQMEDIQALIRSRAVVPSSRLADVNIPLGELAVSRGAVG